MNNKNQTHKNNQNVEYFKEMTIKKTFQTNDQQTTMKNINIKTRRLHTLDLNMIKLKNKEYKTRKNTPSPVESEKDFSIFVL